MKVKDLKAGRRFRLPGSDVLYEALTEPSPYPYGRQGDVVIDVRWLSGSRLKREALAFRGEMKVRPA